MGRSIKSLQHFAMSSLVVLFICFTKLFFLVATGEGTDQTRCIEREHKALQFKNGFVDDYGILSTWNKSSQDCCLWRGVGCSNRTHNVIKLDLHGYWSYDKYDSYFRVGLSGAINSSLRQFHHFKHLDLSGNSFPQIGSLRRLRHLDLSNIAFGNTEWLYKLALLEYLDFSFLNLSESSNTLGTAITRLPLLSVLKLRRCLLQNMSLSSLPSTNFLKSLSILDISENYVSSSSIYPWLFNFSGTLTNIDLSSNELLGSIPEAFGAFKILQDLRLDHIGLEGGIPRIFGNFSSLRVLDLKENNLNEDLTSLFHLLAPARKSIELLELGSFPNKFERRSNLSILDLADNQITGVLPDLSALSSLRELYFERNHVEGTLDHLANLSRPVYLDLSYNSMVLELNSDWSPTFSLDVISLSSCTLGPSFPIWLRTQKNFTIVDISNALINDSVPNCAAFLLRELHDVGQNNLSGQIPAWIGKNLSRLHVLSLESNGFHGTMPTSICSLANIQILDISCNNISGTIPSCIGNLNGMTEIKDSSSFFVFNAALPDRTRLPSLDLSSNNFNGNIPAEITNLTGLVGLNLSRNNLTWIIPPDIGRLRWMDFLDLSRNHLVGGIPTSLSQLTNLGMLDLSNNNLSGRRPSNTQLQSFNASSYSELCGLPLLNKCPGDLVPQITPTTQETDVPEDKDKFITHGFFISILIGLAFGFWGFFGILVVNDPQRHNGLRLGDISFLRVILLRGVQSRYITSKIIIDERFQVMKILPRWFDQEPHGQVPLEQDLIQLVETTL
ncbi:putative leucine-rich repeat protein [Tanacetum coccineum]